MTPPNYPQQPGPYGPPPQGYPPAQPQWGQQPPPPAYTPAQGFPGQPGMPGQPPMGPPQQPFGAAPMPMPPKKSTKGAKILLAVVGLGIVGLVVSALIAGKSSPAGADPGECIKVNSASASNADVEKIDCGSTDAAFKVAKNLDSSTAKCPTGEYAEFRSTGRRSKSGYKLCLMLNAKQGECFKEEGSFVAGKTTKVTCSSSATYQVSKVVTSVDKNACDPGEKALTYAEPATTICIAEPS